MHGKVGARSPGYPLVNARTIRRIETLAACLLLGAQAWAAEAAPVPPVRSPHIREAIRAGLPKYQPQAAGDDVTMRASSEQAVEKDGTLNLPKVTVEAKSRPRIREYDMLTPKGRMELALKRYPGVRIGNLFGLNSGIALALLKEEVEAEKRRELRATVENIIRVDDVGGRELRRLMQNAIAHPNTDWLKGRRSGR